MMSYLNKWILAGSLGAVFAITLVFGYGPGYGGAFFAGLGLSQPLGTKVIEMSPSDMVTNMVTTPKMVTNKRVTIVTSVSPSLNPIETSLSSDTISTIAVTPTPTIPPLVTTIAPSRTPTPSVTNPMTPTPYLMAPSTAGPTVTVSAAPTSTPTPAPTQLGKININTADVNLLENITGVGPTIAQRIVDYRVASGPFQTIEDIIKVKGIGDTTFLKMKDQITVGP